MKRAHVIIRGRVQGVFFRQHTKDNARQLGLKGWVRNTSQGDVEAIFEGEEEKIKEMIQLCWLGSPSSDVSDVHADWEEYKGEFEGFYVRY